MRIRSKVICKVAICMCRRKQIPISLSQRTTRSLVSYVPRPIPSFSMLHAEKGKGLVYVCDALTRHMDTTRAKCPIEASSFELQISKGRFVCTLLVS